LPSNCSLAKLLVNIHLDLLPECYKLTLASSVVSAQADVFAKNLTKIGKILRIFDELDEIKSRWDPHQS